MNAATNNIVSRTLLAAGLGLALTGLAAADCAPASAAGKKQFSKCAACHSLEPGVHRMGPSLANLQGRRAGSVTGFTFSPAMAQSERVWNRDTLSAFLANPGENMPGNVMPFGGLRNAEQREALIEYLLSDPSQAGDDQHCP